MKTKTPTQRYWWAGFLRIPSALAISLSLIILLTACTSGGSSAQPFAFPADDGLLLQGRIYGTGTPAIILLHDYENSLNGWSSFAERLSAKGFLVLSYDMRGHNSSPGKKDVSQTITDLSAAARSMRRNSRPLMFLIGEGLGGIAALNVAALEQVLGVVTVSSPTSLRGISGIAAVPRVESPKLFIASEGDTKAAESATLYSQRALEPKETFVAPGRETGTKLVESNNAVREQIFAFLDANKNRESGQ